MKQKRRKMKRKLLVTGCGRSGTKYTAAVLRKAGFDIAHEQMRTEGTVSAPFVGYTHPVAGQVQFGYFQRFGHTAGECPNDFLFEQVWHQTRDPLKVIGSIRDMMPLTVKRWARWAFDQPVGTKQIGDLKWAAMHWLITNTMAESIADWHYRIEDIESVWPEMLERLELKEQPLPKVSKTINRCLRNGKHMGFRPAKEVYAEITYPTWDDIAEVLPDNVEQMKERAAAYGYA
jgi:hypothetical protein